MDINANLREQLEIARKLSLGDMGTAGPDDAVWLAELVLAMDEWIAKGGFLPDKWAIAIKRNSGRY